jgi:hypothetical protein
MGPRAYGEEMPSPAARSNSCFCVFAPLRVAAPQPCRILAPREGNKRSGEPGSTSASLWFHAVGGSAVSIAFLLSIPRSCPPSSTRCGFSHSRPQAARRTCRRGCRGAGDAPSFFMPPHSIASR